MHQLILVALLLLPLAAQASGDEHCEHSEPRSLQLDFSAVKTVVFDIGGNDLDVRAGNSPDHKVDGRACASNAKELGRLVLTQERSGDRLLVHARREGNFSGIFIGNHYAYMKLRASVPDTVAVQLKVDSGDASVEGARAASVDTGSGDVRASRIRILSQVRGGSHDVPLPTHRPRVEHRAIAGEQQPMPEVEVLVAVASAGCEPLVESLEPLEHVAADGDLTTHDLVEPQHVAGLAEPP